MADLGASDDPGSGLAWQAHRVSPGVHPARAVGAVTVEDFGAVGAVGGGDAVGVQGDGPAPLVDRDMVMHAARVLAKTGLRRSQLAGYAARLD